MSDERFQPSAEKIGQRLTLASDPTITPEAKAQFEGRDSIQATREFIMAGVGFTIAPYSALIAEVERGLMSGQPMPKYSIRRTLVRRNDRPISRALGEFRAMLIEETRGGVDES